MHARFLGDVTQARTFVTTERKCTLRSIEDAALRLGGITPTTRRRWRTRCSCRWRRHTFGTLCNGKPWTCAHTRRHGPPHYPVCGALTVGAASSRLAGHVALVSQEAEYLLDAF